MKEDSPLNSNYPPKDKKDPSTFEEVDVFLDESDTDDDGTTSDEIEEAKAETQIPKEWKGKSKEEIELLFKIRDLETQIDKKEKEHFDKFARLQAEFENFRKRSLKEKDDYIKYAGSQLISKLLPILDSADSMLKLLEPKLGSNEYKGIQMFIKELYGVLEKEGLTPIKAEGTCFDPFVHEILTLEYTDECPDETILGVIQKGYRFKDRVLRPAKVKIAKPIPKTKPPSTEDEAKEEDKEK